MAIRKIVVTVLWCSMVTVSCNAGRRPAAFPLPDSKKNCATCHVIEGSRTTALLAKKLSDLCLDCHSDRVAPQEHRVGITPSMEVKRLPLADGKLTCVTCHDPHKNPHGALLRLPETELCLSCHPY
jgi:predicted CXXCH cytochrome family protein